MTASETMNRWGTCGGAGRDFEGFEGFDEFEGHEEQWR